MIKYIELFGEWWKREVQYSFIICIMQKVKKIKKVWGYGFNVL